MAATFTFTCHDGPPSHKRRENDPLEFCATSMPQLTRTKAIGTRQNPHTVRGFCSPIGCRRRGEQAIPQNGGLRRQKKHYRKLFSLKDFRRGTENNFSAMPWPVDLGINLALPASKVSEPRLVDGTAEQEMGPIRFRTPKKLIGVPSPENAATLEGANHVERRSLALGHLFLWDVRVGAAYPGHRLSQSTGKLGGGPVGFFVAHFCASSWRSTNCKIPPCW